jgi:phage-related protein
MAEEEPEERAFDENNPKPVRWIASSKDDLSLFPDDVKRRMGGAIWEAQISGKARYAKPLKGYGGVLEIVDDYDGDTFRAVYTVRFAKAVYVLHAFQKKAKKGIATPKADIERIDTRLAAAKKDYEQWVASKK